MVENVAGTTFDRIAPTKDLFLSSESLQKQKKTQNREVTKLLSLKRIEHAHTNKEESQRNAT